MLGSGFAGFHSKIVLISPAMIFVAKQKTIFVKISGGTAKRIIFCPTF
jgi:hypothetical protein